ncbi:MAG: hypothetical protein DRH26_00565 [Deltaproteobacteria bacterium]|nr:MAG: hypothetical protein DRH26_00565 [Deltaproteobacteria bacterium]
MAIKKLAQVISKKDEIEESLEKVANYMVIDFGYSMSVCLPYKDGAAIVKNLEKAEKVAKYYNHEKIKFEDEAAEYTFNIITQKEYRSQKMLKLLGITGEEDDNKK